MQLQHRYLAIIILAIMSACDSGSPPSLQLTTEQTRHISEFQDKLSALTNPASTNKKELRDYVGALAQRNLQGSMIKPLAGLFRQLYESDNEDDRFYSLVYLNTINKDKHFDIIQRAVTDKSGHVRRTVAELMGSYPQEKTQQLLVKLFDDADASVRIRAAESINDVHLLSSDARKKHYVAKNSNLGTVTYVGDKPEILATPLEQINVTSNRFRLKITGNDRIERRTQLYENAMDRDERLHFLIADGDLDAIKVMATSRNLLTIKGHSNIGALSMAALASQDHLVEYFIDNDANIEEQDADGNTPLLHAVAAQSISTVDLLIKKGANINYSSSPGETAIFEALKSQDVAMLLSLVKLGADINTPLPNVTSGRNGALWKAVEMQAPDMIIMIMDLGAKIGILDTDNNTPLSEMIDNFKLYKNCCTEEQVNEANLYAQAIITMIQKGADINQKNVDGFSPRDLLNLKFYRIVNGLENTQDTSVYKTYYTLISDAMNQE